MVVSRSYRSLGCVFAAVAMHTLAHGQQLYDVYHSCFGSVYNTSNCYPRQPITQFILDVVPGWPTLYLASDGYLRWWGQSWALGSNPIGPIRVDRGVDVGLTHVAIIMADGSFRGIPLDGSGNSYGQCNPPSDLGPLQRVEAGRFHTVTLTLAGGIRCFGMTSYGQCNAPSGDIFVDIAAGGLHSAGVRSDGTVACWGSGFYGESLPPAGLADVIQVDASYHTTVALCSDGSVRAWGQGDINPPATLPPLVEMRADYGGSAVGRTADGQVVCWGSNADFLNGLATGPGIKARPLNLPPASSIALGGGTVGIVSTQGEMVLWGYDGSKQATPPKQIDSISDAVVHNSNSAWISALGQVEFSASYFGSRANLEGTVVRSIKLGAEGTHSAILADGRLYVWSGQPTLHEQVPAVAHYARSAACSANSVAAIDLGGNLRTWGTFQSATPVPPPTSASAIRSVECGDDYCLALSESGTLRFWGVPPPGVEQWKETLGVVRDVAITGYSGEVLWAVGADGGLAVWSSNGSFVAPNNLPPLESIEAYQHALVGRSESGDWWWWTEGSTVANPLGSVLRAVPGGMQFWCNSTPSYQSGTAVLPPLAAGTPVIKQFSGLRRAASDVQLRIGVIADLNLSTEFATVRLNDTPFATIFVTRGSDCPEIEDSVTVTIPMAQFNQLIASGSLTIRLDASVGVNGTQCPLGRTTLQVYYTAEGLDCNGNGTNDACEITAGTASDCDRNGVPDSCDLMQGALVDLDGNGILDACEPDCDHDRIPDGIALANGTATDCNGNLLIDACEIALGGQDKDGDGRLDECEIARGDFDLSGVIDGADLGALLSLWGFANPPYGDLDADGIVGGGDLAIILNGWGVLK